MALFTRRNVAFGLAGASALCIWGRKEMIAPALNAFGQELDSTRGHAMRLEAAEYLQPLGTQRA